MMTLSLTQSQADELYEQCIFNPEPRNRIKLLVIYLRANGYSRQEIVRLARVNEDTVTNLIKKYMKGGLDEVLKNNYYKPKGELEPHVDKLKELFKNQHPHTVNEAIELIYKATGIRLKRSACWNFLKKIGLKYRRCGLVPGKATDDKKQQQAQQEFHDKQLQPLLEEAKQGKRTVLFADASHFVMGAFLGLVWCFMRILLPSASGRQRYNVLGAYNPVTYQMITITNESYINHEVVCQFLNKIAQIYTDTVPVTLVLDNAKYQKCQAVQQKAAELGIELLYLPTYSPNLNLIERVWRFVKQQVLSSRHYDKFKDFKHAIDNCLAQIGTSFKSKMQTLMTLKFQLFSEKTENLSG